MNKKDKPIIINITGFNNTGKDTVARLLKKIVEPVSSVENIPIAESIREMASVASGWGHGASYPDDFNHRVLKEKPTEPFNQFTRRELMIEITKKMFEIDKDFWWKTTLQRIEKSDARIITISDVRYSEWLEFLYERDYSFYTIELVKADTYSQYPRIPTWILKDLGIDYVCINNDSTIKDLENQLKTTLEKWALR